MQIEIEPSPSDQTLATVRAGMRRYAESHVSWEEYSDLAIIARDDGGTVIGAAFGETGRGWLHVSVVWVDERARGQRLGTRRSTRWRPRRSAEAVTVHISTPSAIRPRFYEKLGYEVFGTLEDYPVGHQRFYMRKRLGEG